MRIQLIANQRDALGCRAKLVHNKLDVGGPIAFGAPRRRRHISPTNGWLESNKEITGPVALVITVILLDLAWLHRQWRLYVANELLVAFIHTNDWKTRVKRALIDIQNLFHIRDESRTLLRRDAPHLVQPGLGFVFLALGARSHVR